jgi:hypothetical protein
MDCVADENGMVKAEVCLLSRPILEFCQTIHDEVAADFYKAATAQARLDMKRLIWQSVGLDKSHEIAAANLKSYIEQATLKCRSEHTEEHFYQEGLKVLEADFERWQDLRKHFAYFVETEGGGYALVELVGAD